ncbi:cytochrome P450 3A17 [Purpureocillium lavendulum]|uniref:Cytochrome P450 3A17 n=1 Tax=Purpureocillium lavendulum TaxID=1247861 RepID=A0AB34FK98_9HYPO|nr:cytochrome P450 3A17 [Purpureocillium lavendulum]
MGSGEFKLCMPFLRPLCNYDALLHHDQVNNKPVGSASTQTWLLATTLPAASNPFEDLAADKPVFAIGTSQLFRSFRVRATTSRKVDAGLLEQEAAEDRRLHAESKQIWRDRQLHSCLEGNETTPWLKHTGWPQYFESRPLDMITVSAIRPTVQVEARRDCCWGVGKAYLSGALLEPKCG